MTALREMRSAAGVLGDNPDGIVAALAIDADVLMVDLELPPGRRAVARATVNALLETPPLRPVFVRVASTGRPDELADDLAAVVRHGLVAVIVPDCEHPDEVREVSSRLEEMERVRRLPLGSIGLLPLPETALAIRRYYDILTASPRIVAAWLPSSDGGDLCRDVGYQWSVEGTELVYLRSKVVVDARAAGVRHILDSGWRDRTDVEGFDRDTVTSRSFGYTGRLVYDGAQTAIANRVYGSTAAAAGGA